MLNKVIRAVSLGCLLVFVSFNGFAQKGSVKVFSELTDVSIYLDDIYKGKNINSIDSVPAGSHYLKVTKDSVIVLGELIAVRANEVTTILIKDTKEIRDKILASKYDQQQKYKALKLDVLLSTSYVTETIGGAQTNEEGVANFPGYYALSSKTESTIISNTFTSADWFLTKGNARIDELQLARITNNVLVLDAYEQRALEVEKLNRNRAIRSRVTMGVVGAGIGALGAVMIMNRESISKDVLRILDIIYGAALAGVGAGMVISSAVTRTDKFMTDKHQVGFLYLISFDEAVKITTTYNQNLKKELGLPVDYEPVM